METLPPDHGLYRTVVRVANRLLTANRDLAEMQRNWAVTVVADDSHVNAYAMEVGRSVRMGHGRRSWVGYRGSRAARMRYGSRAGFLSGWSH